MDANQRDLVLVLRCRFAAALACIALLSASHPFSGLQLIAVLGIWGIIEWLIGDEDRPPSYFPPALLLLGVFHIGYYLCFLDRASGEHRVLQQQWSLAWILPGYTMLVAYGPVAFLAAAAVVNCWRRSHSLTQVQRILVIWAGVSLALANHNLLIAPIQPLHFTRGYIWTPLFLPGAPVLLEVLDAALRRGMVYVVLPAMLFGLLLFDNMVWFLYTSIAEHHGADSPGLALDAQERAVLTTFQDPRYTGFLVVSQSPKLGYLATVYSPLRSWLSHRFNTPYGELRQAEINRFFSDGAEPAEWLGRPLLAVVARDGHIATVHRLEQSGFYDVLTNKRYVLLARLASSGK